MSARQLLGLSALTCLVVACGPPGDGAVACGELEPRSDREVALCNGLEQAVIAELALPEGTPPASGWPSVVLLHGSGGLLVADDGFPCSETLQDEFQLWSELLTARGYAVIMPDSFYSRGFCDWHERRTVPRELTERERLVVRTFDAAAAGEFLCDDARFDCSHIAVMGFSNGASTTLMVMQDDLSVAEDERLRGLTGRPEFVGGVAYYPGCGLQGQLPNGTETSKLEQFYYPMGPVWVPHAAKDSLVDNCEEVRDPQVDMVAEQRGVDDDMFELEVYAGAKHGFDAWDTGDPKADLDARTDAQSKTLARLDEWL